MMLQNFSADTPKETVFKEVSRFLTEHGFTIRAEDQSRPWGGFFVIEESQATQFIQFFLSGIPEAEASQKGMVSPKILIVQEGMRLSWQYHHRRSEVWKVISGKAGVVTSDTDLEQPVQHKETNDVIVLKQGERHRLIGTEGWAILAEIWQHTDHENPSDESDIVRITDDFGR